MKNLIIGLNAMREEHKKEIHDEFMNSFGVDLDSENYREETLETKWNCLVRECTVSEYKESFSEYVRLFLGQLLSVINIDSQKGENDEDRIIMTKIIRTPQEEAELRERNLREFEKLIGNYMALLDNYNVYECDIWLNVWLTLQYKKSDELLSKQESRNDKKGRRKTISGVVDYTEGSVADKNGRKYLLPFKEEVGKCFCVEYLKYTLKNSGVLFWTEKEDNETVTSKEESVENIIWGDESREINLCKDRDYSRFSYHKIKEIEEQNSFQNEDKILFHKTINGILVRNMINMMINCNGSFEAENYINLIDRLCGCKSLVWQNLIGCLFVLVKAYQRELKTMDIYDDVALMIYTWLTNIEKINYTMSRLIEGVLYLYKDAKCDNDFIERKCKYYLSDLEIYNKDIEKYWEDKFIKLRVTEEIKKNHKSYEWIYAILQREVIDKTKQLYANDQFQEKAFTVDIVCKGGEIKKIPAKIADLQPDLQKAREWLDAQMHKSDKGITAEEI